MIIDNLCYTFDEEDGDLYVIDDLAQKTIEEILSDNNHLQDTLESITTELLNVMEDQKDDFESIYYSFLDAMNIRGEVTFTYYLKDPIKGGVKITLGEVLVSEVRSFFVM